MQQLLCSAVFGAMAVGVLAISAPMAEASASECKASANFCYVAPACKNARTEESCGVITYANKGGYTVGNVKLSVMSNQPSDKANISDACQPFNVEYGSQLLLGKWVEFIVPAQCAYNIKINIAAGSKKDRNLFLTPGCLIESSTDGTTLQNEWHLKVKWTPKAKGAGESGEVVNADGNKCGRVKHMGSASSG